MKIFMNTPMRDIADLMDQSRTSVVVDETAWCEQAADIFAPAHEDGSAAINFIGAATLHSFPFVDAANAISQSGNNRQAFTAMRFMRKVLLIGRDSFNITNSVDMIDMPYLQPLRRFTSAIGKIADCNAADDTLVRATELQAYHAEIAVLYFKDAERDPVSNTILRDRMIKKISLDILTREVEASEATYHAARRNFRSVLHVGISSYINRPTPDKLEHIKQGVELNKYYGLRHSSLLAPSK